MLRRYQAGENLATIGATMGFTRERVRQIVKQSGVRMPWEYKCAVKDCFTSPRSPGRYCFAHQRRLDHHGDPLWVKPLLREQHGTRACYQAGGCRCELCRTAYATHRARTRA